MGHGALWQQAGLGLGRAAQKRCDPRRRACQPLWVQHALCAGPADALGPVERRGNITEMGTDTDHVDPGIQQAHPQIRPAETLGDGPHVHIVADHHTPVAQALAQHPLDQAARQGGGHARINGGKQDMGRHHRPAVPLKGAERQQIRRLQRRQIQRHFGQAIMGIGARGAMPGTVLQAAQHAG